jgi:MarR family transcriptional regulator for hemolysin
MPADATLALRTAETAKAQTLGVTQAQPIILPRLERQPDDVSQTELADAAEVTPMTIARLIDRLEELRLVERYADLNDRRVWRLR